MKYLPLLGLLFVSTAYPCNLADLDRQHRALVGKWVENPNYTQLDNLKEVYQKASAACSDPLDTLELALKVSELQILLGTGLIEAENQLLTLKNEIYPIKGYYLSEYQQILGQLLSLYIKSGRQTLAYFYAKQVLKDSDIEDDELKLDALSLTRPLDYNAREDQERLIAALEQDNKLLFSSTVVPYHASTRYLNYLQRLLSEGAYSELKKQVRAFDAGDYIDKKTTFVSDNLLSIAVMKEIVSLNGSHRHYNLDKGISGYFSRKPENVSLENQLLINLLSAFNRGPQRRASLEDAIRTFRLILGAYDYGRQIKMKPQINVLLVSLLNAYPNSKEVQKVVFEISQHLFVTNPVEPVMRLEGKSEQRYKQLVSLQQALFSQIKSGELNNESLIQSIASLASKFQASSRTSASDMTNVQSYLRQDETLLYVVDLGTASVTYYINSRDFRVKVVDSNALYQDIAAHRKNIIEREDARVSGNKLAKTLEIEMISSPAISVVSYGVLEQLPIATLYNSRSKKWLVEEKSVSRYSLLNRIGVNEAQVGGTNNRLAISDPVFYEPPPLKFETSPYFESQNTVIKLDALPDTLLESLALLGQHSRYRRLLLTQEEAVESTVKRLINQENWNFISFSTHTIFPSKSNPVPYPGLAMSIDFDDQSNDSILQADEIANLNIRDSSVLLAACNTASAGEVEGSFNSLITSFQYAGASSVIASQWNVFSDETYEFMSQVADLINTDSYSPPAAIREVQAMLATKLSNRKDSASIWGAWETYQ